MIRPYANYSFDVDGTLVLQDYMAKVRALCWIAQECGFVGVDSALMRDALAHANLWYEREASAFTPSIDDLWMHYASRIVEEIAVDSEDLISRYAAYFKEYNRNASNFFVSPMARHLLNQFASRGWRLYAVSANVDANRRLQMVSLQKLFCRVLSPRSGSTKADLFEELLARERLSPRDLMHVGDDPVSDRDIPESYGIDSFLVVDPDLRDVRNATELVDLAGYVESGYRRLAELLNLRLPETRGASSCT